MADFDIRQLARIRRQLRERLLARRSDGAAELLATLRRVADSDHASPEIRSEYQRWQLRFDLLGGAAAAFTGRSP